PYYPSHPDLKKLQPAEPEIMNHLMESMNHAFYICNSDKYSFILNFMNLPQQQQSMIVTHFEAELQQMKEMESEDQVLGQEESSNSVFIQYIQDLYRFFKLFPYKSEFEDIFRQKIRFTSLGFYKQWFENPKFLEKLAGFYFDKEHYPESIEVFHYLSEKADPKAEYFEKPAYAYQKMGKFYKAIEHYKKAELFDVDRLWVLKQLGQCLIKVNDFENAYIYLKDASALKPDDLRLQIQLGQCCLNMKKFAEALEHFGKVRFFQPDNLKVIRPVAYCHFVIGKLEDAAHFYKQILDSDSPSPFDWMNAGHVQLCLGNKAPALGNYRQSLIVSTFSDETFVDAFEEDIPFLLENGIAREEIPLIMDYLLFQRS
ncbi:MAG: CDC27 family protein, partial [Bacteroidota bacterium]